MENNYYKESVIENLENNNINNNNNLNDAPNPQEKQNSDNPNDQKEEVINNINNDSQNQNNEINTINPKQDSDKTNNVTMSEYIKRKSLAEFKEKEICCKPAKSKEDFIFKKKFFSEEWFSKDPII